MVERRDKGAASLCLHFFFLNWPKVTTLPVATSGARNHTLVRTHEFILISQKIPYQYPASNKDRKPWQKIIHPNWPIFYSKHLWNLLLVFRSWAGVTSLMTIWLDNFTVLIFYETRTYVMFLWNSSLLININAFFFFLPKRCWWQFCFLCKMFG